MKDGTQSPQASGGNDQPVASSEPQTNPLASMTPQGDLAYLQCGQEPPSGSGHILQE